MPEPLEQQLEQEGFVRLHSCPLILQQIHFKDPVLGKWKQPAMVRWTVCGAYRDELSVILKSHPKEVRLVNAAEVSPVYRSSEDCYFVYVRE